VRISFHKASRRLMFGDATKLSAIAAPLIGAGTTDGHPSIVRNPAAELLCRHGAGGPPSLVGAGRRSHPPVASTTGQSRPGGALTGTRDAGWWWATPAGGVEKVSQVPHQPGPHQHGHDRFRHLSQLRAHGRTCRRAPPAARQWGGEARCSLHCKRYGGWHPGPARSALTHLGCQNSSWNVSSTWGCVGVDTSRETTCPPAP
jgi:hypothetical protein